MLYLNTIYDITFLKKKASYNKSDFSINGLLENDKHYKVEAYRLSDFTFVNDYTLNVTNHYSNAEKSPSNALEIQLEKGAYAIVYKSGGIVSNDDHKLNSCVKISKGFSLEFDEYIFDDDIVFNAENVAEYIAAKNYSSEKYTLIHVVKGDKIRMWIKNGGSGGKDNVFGELVFSIYKIDQSEQEPVRVLSTIIDDDDDFQINGENGVYEISIAEMKFDNDDIQSPEPKYPVGTYQITLNQEVGRNKREDVLQELIASNKASLHFINNKLDDLTGIEIPPDVDPLNRYIMLGKIELDLFIDFKHDKYYLYPTSYAECFMNLFVPKRTDKIVEETDDYVLWHITDYELVEFDFRDPTKIRNAIKRWISCNDKDIRDEHELYFYVDTFNLYAWSYTRYRDIIEKYFIYIKIDADVNGCDNVGQQVFDPDETIDTFDILNCTWQKWTRTNKFNYIDWNIGEWESVNTEDDNDIMINATGSGVIRVSRKHFENITNANLDVDESGELVDIEQFKDLHINLPVIKKYNRFQYWLGINL